MRLKIALEWFTNPDHLPFILGIETGEYNKAGLDVELISPDDHYDGFKALQENQIDIHINEPIHLFEHYNNSIKSLGCYFETRGGVMIKQESIKKLKTNQPIKITTPASNDVTNRVGFEILSRYAKKEGFRLDFENVQFIQTDFYHLKNLQSGDFDGAWLCFYNFEGIEAEYIGYENLFIDQFLSPYPNFSALEMITTKEILNQKKEVLEKFIKVTSEMIEYAKKKPIEAKVAYYDYTQTKPEQLMDKIIEDTITRFKETILPDRERWLSLYEMLCDFDFCDLSENEYDEIWTLS